MPHDIHTTLAAIEQECKRLDAEGTKPMTLHCGMELFTEVAKASQSALNINVDRGPSPPGSFMLALEWNGSDDWQWEVK